MIILTTGKGDESVLNENTIFYPENSKHPIEQFYWAKKLVKEHKKDVYIHTYSPVLIEAIDTIAKKENIDIIFGMFRNGKLEYINGNWIVEMYDDLARGYDKIDELKYTKECKCCGV